MARGTGLPVFIIVAALATAAVWKVAPRGRPVVGRPEGPAIKLADEGPERAGRTEEPAGKVEAEGAAIKWAAAPEIANAPQSAAHSPDALPPQFDRQPQLDDGGQLAAPSQLDGRAFRAAETGADDDDDPDALTPEQRRARYAELTEQLRVLREKILRANVEKSAEGRAALAVTREYKRAVAEAKDLEARYGRTDSRVTRKHADLAALKDRVRAANAKYKAWKDAHPGEPPAPEEDPVYRELQARRALYRAY